MIINKLTILLSGVTVGIILFQTIIIAPTSFKILEKKQSRHLLRSIFPNFFIFIIFLNLISLGISLYEYTKWIIILIYSLNIFFSIFCYLIIPITNKSTDEKNISKFRFLHRLSVFFTFLIIFGSISILFF